MSSSPVAGASSPFQITEKARAKFEEARERAREKAFLTTARIGTTTQLKVLVSEGINPNVADSRGWTALHWAVNRGEMSMVWYLVEQVRANMEATTRLGGTPLHRAAYAGRLDVVQYLLEERANAMAVTDDKQSALHMAAHGGSLETVQYLVQHAKADPALTTKSGQTACAVAFECDHAAIVAFLLPISPPLPTQLVAAAIPVANAEQPTLSPSLTSSMVPSSALVTSGPKLSLHLQVTQPGSETASISSLLLSTDNEARTPTSAATVPIGNLPPSPPSPPVAPPPPAPPPSRVNTPATLTPGRFAFPGHRSFEPSPVQSSSARALRRINEHQSEGDIDEEDDDSSEFGDEDASLSLSPRIAQDRPWRTPATPVVTTQLSQLTSLFERQRSTDSTSLHRNSLSSSPDDSSHSEAVPLGRSQSETTTLPSSSRKQLSAAAEAGSGAYHTLLSQTRATSDNAQAANKAKPKAHTKHSRGKMRRQRSSFDQILFSLVNPSSTSVSSAPSVPPTSASSRSSAPSTFSGSNGSTLSPTQTVIGKTDSYVPSKSQVSNQQAAAESKMFMRDSRTINDMFLDGVKDGDSLLVRRLLSEHHVDPSISDKSGWTAMHWAAQSGNVEVLRALQDHQRHLNELSGGKISAPANSLVSRAEEDGWTALHLACMNGQLDMVRYLVEECQAEINAVTRECLTPLHYAASTGNTKLAQYLVKAKASVDAPSGEGWTALHMAAYRGKEDLLNFLLHHTTASARALTKKGESAYDILMQFNSETDETWPMASYLKYALSQSVAVSPSAQQDAKSEETRPASATTLERKRYGQDPTQTAVSSAATPLPIMSHPYHSIPSAVPPPVITNQRTYLSVAAGTSSSVTTYGMPPPGPSPPSSSVSEKAAPKPSLSSIPPTPTPAPVAAFNAFQTRNLPFPSLVLAEWSVEEVHIWASKSFQFVAELLKENCVTGEMLETVNDEELVDLGVAKLLHRRTLLQGIGKLRTQLQEALQGISAPASLQTSAPRAATPGGARTASFETLELKSAFASVDQAKGMEDRHSDSVLNEVNFEEIENQQKVGEGNFGIVYNSIWRGQVVAVKYPKHMRDPASQRDFHHEIEISGKLGTAPCIPTYFGACRVLPHLALLMQYMQHGSVEDILARTAQQGRGMSVSAILQIAVDASAGVLHLHQKGVVHRDIAARNFLVERMDHGIARCVISDFGLSRCLPESVEEGRTESDEQIPVKSLAPEAWKRGIYSKQSDVFAFGIFLWELLSCSEPYPGMSGMDAARAVAEQGLRPLMKCDKETLTRFGLGHIPLQLARLMTQCWAEEAYLRPTMENVNKRLLFLLEMVDDHDMHLVVAPPEPLRPAPGIRRAPAGAPAVAPAKLYAATPGYEH